MTQIDHRVYYGFEIERNGDGQAAESLMREMQAVVAESHQPVMAFGDGFDASARILTRFERCIVEAGPLVVARKRVGKIFEIDGRTRERVVVVGRFDANLRGQGHGIRSFRAAGGEK